MTDRRHAIQTFSPGYVWPNPAFPFRLYLDDPRCRVFLLENLTHNWVWMAEWHQGIRKTDFFLVQPGWAADAYLVRKGREMIDALGLDIGNFYILCNEEQEVELFTQHGFACDVINQNAWLEENGVMKILPEAKRYDAVYVGRLAPFKRHELAAKVANLALVAGHDDWSKAKNEAPPHAYLNEAPLTRDKVAEVINRSRAGLILSAKEGACYASSEYLLCGVPVVSTRSVGGRHVWYNDTNSLIVDDHPDAVAEGVRHFVDNPPDPQVIRQMHIDQAEGYRRKFIAVLQDVLDRFDAGEIDAASYFRTHFFEKMRKSQRPDFPAIFG